MLSGIALLFASCRLLPAGALAARASGGAKRLRFYPTTMMIGLALQNIQVFAHPEVDHTIQQKYADEAEQDDEGDPDDPQKLLEGQLRRIRNGETVDCLRCRHGRAEIRANSSARKK